MDKIVINKEFAKKYDRRRKAEELQRLKDRYGNVDNVSSSSEESEDETAEAINSKLERDFFQTFAHITRKDPVIYKTDQTFFNEVSDGDGDDDDDDDDSENDVKDKPKKPYLLKDAERKAMLEHEGRFDVKDEQDEVASGSYCAELDNIKKEILTSVKSQDETDDNEDFLTRKEYTRSEPQESYTKLEDLDGYWQDPNLDERDKYLRDYLVNRKYIDKEDDRFISSSDDHDKMENDADEEMFVKKQENFEYKYNFRFEQPDSTFIQSYPRTVGDSVRRVDNKGKKKRLDRKQRKEGEKKRKVEELKKLKQLKREQILEKINLLKTATGNTNITFTDQDVQAEFNAEDYDKRMKELFGDEFYAIEEEEKPHFSDIGGENGFGEETNWNEFDAYEEDYDETLPDCEQPDFVMDCDYEPTAKLKTTKLSKKDKKKKKTDFYEEISRKRTDNAEDKTVDEHLAEYYAMDYDDMIGDVPCRFKYRSVPANDYGLTTTDILLADNRTLNSWCSLKKVVQHRSVEEENYLRRSYSLKARGKKKKHFAQIYKELEEKDKLSDQRVSEEVEDTNYTSSRKLNSRQRRRKREKERRLKLSGMLEDNTPSRKVASSSKGKRSIASHRKQKRNVASDQSETYKRLAKLDPIRLEAYGLKPKKVLKKAKYSLNTNIET